MSLRTSDRCHWCGNPYRTPRLPPWLPLWGSCHEVTERVNSPSPPHSGHLSHRERQDPHPSPASTRLRGSEFPHFDNPSVSYADSSLYTREPGCSRTSALFDGFRTLVGDCYQSKHHRPQPINNPVNHRRGQSIDNHRPGNGEELRPHAQDKPFCLELHRRGGDGIGKAGDGH